ncbi:MAG: hypothetical protein ACREC0_12890 [Methylocella sp.]
MNVAAPHGSCRPFRAERRFFGARANDKEQSLLDLASLAAASLNRDPEANFNALRDREEMGSSGLGEGFALPRSFPFSMGLAANRNDRQGFQHATSRC